MCKETNRNSVSNLGINLKEINAETIIYFCVLSLDSGLIGSSVEGKEKQQSATHCAHLDIDSQESWDPDWSISSSK